MSGARVELRAHPCCSALVVGEVALGEVWLTARGLWAWVLWDRRDGRGWDDLAQGVADSEAAAVRSATAKAEAWFPELFGGEVGP